MSKFSITVSSLIVLSISLMACSEQNQPLNENDGNAPAALGEDANKNNKVEATLMELSVDDDMQETSPKAAGLVTLTGSILFQEMEGGFFGFVADNGKKYTPIGLNKDHLRHGLIVELTGEPLPNMITTTQYGVVIKVDKVVVLDASKALKAGKPVLNQQSL